jgi:hypothetical protein
MVKKILFIVGISAATTVLILKVRQYIGLA